MAKHNFSSSVEDSLQGRSNNEQPTEPTQITDSPNLTDTTDKKGRTDKGLGKNKDGSYRQSNAGRPTMTKAKKKIQLPLTITPATKEKLTKWAEDKPRTAANYLSEYVETHLDEIMENIDKK